MNNLFHISAILQVLIYIEEHLDESLPLEKLAQVARISPFHFHRLFRAYMDETCMEYIQRLRLQRAEEKLRYTDDLITDIAFDVGYETSAGFTKIFNQVLGCSPREYRKKFQPIVKKMVEKTAATPKWTPEYVTRTQETVLFVRKIGDYKETPTLAFNTLFEFLQEQSVDKSEMLHFYSIALDDPKIVDRSKCRFDACVLLSRTISAFGEIGLRKLASGLYACFTYKGPTSGIENAFDEIYRSWWSSTPTITLSDKESLCEHVDLLNNGHVTKIYIPIKKR